MRSFRFHSIVLVLGALAACGGDSVAPTSTPLAALRVLAPTTGTDLDRGYLIRVDGGPENSLIAGDTLALALPTGTHVVELTDIAPNCTVRRSNPALVMLSTVARTDLSFPVACVPRPHTGMDITITTTGHNPDDSYRLVLCSDPACSVTVVDTVVAAAASLRLDLAPGNYTVALRDVAANCRASSYMGVIVAIGAATPLQVGVTCFLSADYSVSVSVTGSDPQSDVQLLVDGQKAGSFAVPGSFTGPSLEGAHVFGMDLLQDNCLTTSARQQTIALTAGVVTPISFMIDCQPYATLTVDVSTTGSNIPTGYYLGLDPDWFSSFTVWTPVYPTDNVSLKLGIGQHEVWLDQVPANCTVGGANPVFVSGDLGTSSMVTFQVDCR